MHRTSDEIPLHPLCIASSLHATSEVSPAIPGLSVYLHEQVTARGTREVDAEGLHRAGEEGDREMILFILQNAYSSEKYKFTNREEWSEQLMRSHSGRRLKDMIPDGAKYAVINASEKIGDNPNSCFEADINHIKKWIKKTNPSVVCACGKIAQDGCKKVGIDYIAAPHPAWRLFSKTSAFEIRDILQSSQTLVT